METLPMLGVPVESSSGGELALEITPNRPDFLSSEGISRALNLFFGKPARKYSCESNPAGELVVDPSVKKIRPFIAMVQVDGVTLDDYSIKSIMQIQEKLHDTLGRKRKKVAIGMHNADVVSPPYKYFACGKKEISFVPLDMQTQMTPEEILSSHPKGISYSHLIHQKCPMITDANGNVLSFPPIINGELTRVKEDTTNLLVDVTGTSKEAVNATLNIISCMLADRGGKIRQVKANGTPCPNLTPRTQKFSKKKCEKLLGETFTDAQISTYLSKMGYAATSQESRIPVSSVLVPPYRADILHEVDIYEDIAIAHGYDNFLPALPPLSTVGKAEEGHICHTILPGAGFLEAKGWLLTSEKEVSLAGLQALGVKIKNPLTEDFTTFRPSLIPGMLRIFAESKNERLPQKIYELGAVSIPREKDMLCAAIISPDSSFSKIKSILDLLMKESGKEYSLGKEGETGISSGAEGQIAGKTFIPGRCAAIIINGKQAGIIGEIHPQILENFSLEQPVALFEMDAES